MTAAESMTPRDRADALRVIAQAGVEIDENANDVEILDALYLVYTNKA